MCTHTLYIHINVLVYSMCTVVLTLTAWTLIFQCKRISNHDTFYAYNNKKSDDKEMIDGLSCVLRRIDNMSAI